MSKATRDRIDARNDALRAKNDAKKSTLAGGDPAKSNTPATQAAPKTSTFTQDYNKARQSDQTLSVSEFRQQSTGSSTPTVEQKAQQSTLSTNIQEASSARNQAAAEKQGQVQGEGEVFDPYAALRARANERDFSDDGTAGNARQFIDEGKAKALRGAYEKQVGPQPRPTPPPEDGWASEEDRLTALAADRKRLADWYRKVGEASQKEVAAVTSTLSDFDAQQQETQAAVDNLVSSLNTSNPGYGTAVENAIQAIKESGGNGDLSPEIMAELTDLASSGLTEDEFQTKAQELISSSLTPGTAATAGITATAEGYTMPSGAVIPKGANGLPDFSSLLNSDATGMDLAYMESVMAQGIAGKGLEMDMRAIVDYAKSEQRAYETTKEEAAQAAKHSEGRVQETIIKAMNENEFNRAQTQMAKANKLEDMTADYAKQEGYWRAQLEAWGADESTAAMSLQFKNKIAFMQEYDRTEADYDLRLMRYNQLDMEANMAAGNRYLEIADKKNLANEKANNAHMDALDNILTGTQDAYANRDIKLMEANKDLFGTLRGIESAASEARLEAEKDSRDFAFDLAKEYADQSGFQWSVEQKADGSWGVVGTDDLTLAARKAAKTGGSTSGSSTSITGDFGMTDGGIPSTGNAGDDETIRQIKAGEISIGDVSTAKGERRRITQFMNANVIFSQEALDDQTEGIFDALESGEFDSKIESINNFPTLNAVMDDLDAKYPLYLSDPKKREELRKQLGEQAGFNYSTVNKTVDEAGLLIPALFL